MSNDSSDDGRKGGGRVLGRGRSIRRAILGERTATSSPTSSPRSSLHMTRSPVVAETRSGEQVRTLREILQPTRDPQDSNKAVAEHLWRPSSHHTRRMLHRLSSMHSTSFAEHRGRLFGAHRVDEYPHSDEPSSGLGAAQRRRTLDQVHQRGKHLARLLGTHKLRRLETSMFLARAQWDADRGLRMVQAVLCARDGIVYDLDVSVGLRGMVNSQGTSCYLDSIMVGLFGAQQSCDGLLYLRDLGTEEANALQAVCRLVVNVLRAGDLVDAALVEELRGALVGCGWLAGSSRRSGQQDAGELYLFLMDTLQMPYLPLGVRMEHGADREAGDCRVATQRMLELSLPPAETDEGPEALLLQALLEQYFFDNRVEQLERRLSSARVRTNAWSILSILPFYTPQSELGAGLAEYPADAPLIVPLLLKRYAADAQGTVRRVSRRVIIPLVLDVTNIVSESGPGDSTADEKNQADGVSGESHRPSTTAAQQPQPPPYPGHVQYRLVLRAAVCHKGASTDAGHYIAYVTRLRPAREGETAGPTEYQGQAPVGRMRAGSVSPLASGTGGGRAIQRRHSWPSLDVPPPPGPDASAWPAEPPPVAQSSSQSATFGSAADWAQCALSMDLRHSAADAADPPPYTQHASLVPTVGEFLRFDDLDTLNDRVQSFASNDGVRGCLDEISRDGYVLFYALQKVELPAKVPRDADLAAGGQMHELASALQWDVDEASARRTVGRLMQGGAVDGKDRGVFEDMAMRWQNIRNDRLVSPVGPLLPSDRPASSGHHHRHHHHHSGHGRSHGNAGFTQRLFGMFRPHW